MTIEMEVILWCKSRHKPSPPKHAALVRAGSWLASWTRQKPTLVGFFCGHKLLTIIVRYAPILGKHLRNLQFQYRLSPVCFVPRKLPGNLLRSCTYSLLPRLACFQLLV